MKGAKGHKNVQWSAGRNFAYTLCHLTTNEDGMEEASSLPRAMRTPLLVAQH